jgi:hypothetical protein
MGGFQRNEHAVACTAKDTYDLEKLKDLLRKVKQK